MEELKENSPREVIVDAAAIVDITVEKEDVADIVGHQVPKDSQAVISGATK